MGTAELSVGFAVIAAAGQVANVILHLRIRNAVLESQKETFSAIHDAVQEHADGCSVRKVMDGIDYRLKMLERSPRRA